MRIIISPAKKMNVDVDSMKWLDLPCLLSRTERLLAVLREMCYEELKDLWKCNDQIARLNVERLERMDLRRGLTPAVLAYEGIQYRYMAPGVFTQQAFSYIQEHLRILSGFYGILRPFDGVTPYRLEMQAKLPVDGAKDLYEFWGGQLGQGTCFRDRLHHQSGLQGVQPVCVPAFRPGNAVYHLRFWGGEERQGDRKGNHLQNGPGRNGALSGGKSD